MRALFVGNSYIDISFATPALPLNDTKIRGATYAVSLGGNSVVAGICAKRLGAEVEFLIPRATDELAHLSQELYAREGVITHTRPTAKSSLAIIIPNGSKRAIMLADEQNYLSPAPALDLSRYTHLHFDGHMPEVTLQLAQAGRARGVITSLDAGTIRQNTHDVLPFMDYVVASQHFCEQLGKTPADTLTYLVGLGVKIAAVTLGADGCLVYENGQHQLIPSIPVAKVVDSAGAGDTFHGAYMYSLMQYPQRRFTQHCAFARVVAALQIQKLGTVAALPTLAEVNALLAQHPINV